MLKLMWLAQFAHKLPFVYTWRRSVYQIRALGKKTSLKFAVVYRTIPPGKSFGHLWPTTFTDEKGGIGGTLKMPTGSLLRPSPILAAQPSRRNLTGSLFGPWEPKLARPIRPK